LPPLFSLLLVGGFIIWLYIWLPFIGVVNLGIYAWNKYVDTERKLVEPKTLLKKSVKVWLIVASIAMFCMPFPFAPLVFAAITIFVSYRVVKKEFSLDTIPQ
jgi:hypothetical protein